MMFYEKMKRDWRAKPQLPGDSSGSAGNQVPPEREIYRADKPNPDIRMDSDSALSDSNSLK